MLKYSLKSLYKEKTKLALSVLGVAFAIVLILVIDGIYAGISRKMTVYIDTNKADVFVMQKGVKNMHMARSYLPVKLAAALEKIDGVQEVAYINYGNLTTKLHDKRLFSYLIGFDPDGTIGGPVNVIKGSAKAQPDEVLLDEVIAEKHNFEIGDNVKLIGKDFRLVGITSGTYSLASTITFFNREALSGFVPPGMTSYFLVKPESDVTPAALVSKIENEIDDVTVMTKAEFSRQDRKIASSMGAEIIEVMTLIGFMSAILVVALSIYTSIIEKIRDFGVLKAIGASNGKLYRIVFTQTTISAFLGLVLGIGMTYMIAALITRFVPEISMVIEQASLVKSTSATFVISFVAAYIPVRSIAKVDPLLVFK